MKVTMSIVTRAYVENMFGAREPRPLSEQLVAFDILKKIRLTKDEKRDYLTTQQGRVFFSEEAEGISTDYDLSGAESEEFLKLLNTAKLAASDVEWALPLRRQLEADDTQVATKNGKRK
jgi:hypothetical protein